jgi:ketosteroid isomerase-like protein
MGISLWNFKLKIMKTKEKVSSQKFENEILDHERAMWKLWSAGDSSGFAESFDEDATLFMWHNVQTQARLDGIKEIQEYLATWQGNIPTHKYEMVDPGIQIFGKTAVMTFEYHITMPETGEVSRWKATDVYRRINDELKIVHSHWSVVD